MKFFSKTENWEKHALMGQIPSLVQGYSICIANALEILQSCTKPLKYTHNL